MEKPLTAKLVDVPSQRSSSRRSKILKATDLRGIETNDRMTVVSPRHVDSQRP
jgi:hypothetical protein